jgi:signal peptidase I
VTSARKWRAATALELVLVVVAALGLALAIEAFIVKPYRIPSGSMLPTLHINERILVDRIGSDLSSPGLDSIVVFHPPQSYAEGCADPREGQTQSGLNQAMPCGVAGRTPSSQTFVKRVVGVPGTSTGTACVSRTGTPPRAGTTERVTFPGRSRSRPATTT